MKIKENFHEIPYLPLEYLLKIKLISMSLNNFRSSNFTIREDLKRNMTTLSEREKKAKKKSEVKD